MSKKHFIKIAAIVSRVEEFDARRQLANELADMFAEENAFFDRTRFLMACEVY